MRYCPAPFWSIEVDLDGNVSCCCPEWTNQYFFGNIYHKSYEEIWNGEKIQKFRQDILNNKYPHCNLEQCCGLDERVFRDPQQDEDFKPDIKAKSPRFVTISVEKQCNCRCFMCRRDLCIADKDSTNILIDKIDSMFLPMLENAEILAINGAGEVFFSKFYQKLIQKTVAINKKIKFDIMTNGLLCTEKNIEKFGLKDRMNVVTVSLHAATKETYNKIVEHSSFDTVLRNIKYLSQLKKENKILDLALTFVLSSKNYKELPDFIEIAKSMGAYANIWPMRLNIKNISGFDIVNPKHKEHKDLLKVLSEIDFDEPHIRANNEIRNLLKKD